MREAVAAGDRRAREPRLHEVQVAIEVPFHDVDALGIVWHGHYYKYLELARTALFRSRGLDARDLVDLGYGMVMIESRCRHVSPLRYGERARVAAWLADVKHRIRIDYEVTREPCGSRVAKAVTVLATLDRDRRLLLCTPAQILARLTESGRSVGDTVSASSAAP
ncbi:MAG: acyl-CoA thioesterase [Deltaproteobacteria bacterium]|nr:acyl-CoA thioesterase [Deltaproteobacteria bacterium]